MASTIQVDTIKDIGGNTIISSNGSGTFTSNLPASAPNVSTATGTLPIANGGTGATTLAAAGLDNTPYFIATMSGSDQSVADNTYAKAVFNSQTAATSGTYNTSTYRFTPGVAGTYAVYARLFTYKGGNAGRVFIINIYKNGSSVATRGFYGGDDSGNITAIDGYNTDISMTLALDSDDYIECFGKIQTTNGSTGSFNTGSGAIFTAHRIII